MVLTVAVAFGVGLRYSNGVDWWCKNDAWGYTNGERIGQQFGDHVGVRGTAWAWKFGDVKVTFCTQMFGDMGMLWTSKVCPETFKACGTKSTWAETWLHVITPAENVKINDTSLELLTFTCLQGELRGVVESSTSLWANIQVVWDELTITSLLTLVNTVAAIPYWTTRCCRACV